MVSIDIVSGVFTGKPDKLQRKIKVAFIRAIISGVNNALDEYLTTVARETGQLRRALDNMLGTQVVGIRGQHEIFVEFNNLTGVISDTGQEYSQYHIFGPHGKAKSAKPYRNPTTPGTKPIAERILLRLIKKKIREALKVEIQAREGLTISLFDIR